MSENQEAPAVAAMNKSGVYGVMAEFDSVEKLLDAAKKTRDAGYRFTDAYSPFPIDGMTEALGRRPTRLQTFVLLCGLTGACSGYLMQYYVAKIAYPLNIGGRPLNSWPAFIPVTFELTVLFSALGAFLGMIVMNNLPMPYHPVFNVPEFSRAQIDRFFLCIESGDPKFDSVQTKAFVESLGPVSVSEVPV